MEENTASPLTHHLLHKYATAFHFYQVKPINELLTPDSSPAILLNDLRALLDTTEFLRRLYSFRTLTGRPEIDHRIRLCADYYAKAAPRPPPMLLPDARSLLIRRGHRLRKIQAGEGSSDETQHHLDSFVEFSQQSSQFLPDLECSSFDEDPSQDDCSLVSEHDLFEECGEEGELNQLDLRLLDQASLGHLICDLSQKVGKEKEDESTTCTSKPLIIMENHPLTTISNKPFQSSTSATHIPHHRHLDKKKNNHYATPDQFLSSIINSFENQDRRVSLQGEKDDLANRRRRIRQKAEDLLRRAKQDMEQGNLQAE